MRTTTKLLTALFLGLLFTNQLNAQVRSDFDKTLDFTKFKTYTFLGWDPGSGQRINDLDKKRILDAFQNELNSRGLTQIEANGDLEITIFVVVDVRTSKTAHTNFNGNMMGMGPGMGGWGWGGRGMGGMGMGGMAMGSSTTRYQETDYKVGTLVIDLFDNNTKELAWQGIISRTLKSNPNRREKGIPKQIRKLMRRYPVKPARR